VTSVPKVALKLVDVRPDVVAALKDAFCEFEGVEIRRGNILAAASHAVVSPANSHGFMDGGIDQAYRSFFGPAIEGQVREACRRRPEGHLPVGASAVIATGDPRVPWLVLAPTMEMPELVAPQAAYRAMRAALRALAPVGLRGDVYCPGLATGVGGVSPTDAAAEMAEAYRDWAEKQKGWEALKEAYPLGSRLTGVVAHRAPFGFFVDPERGGLAIVDLGIQHTMGSPLPKDEQRWPALSDSVAGRVVRYREDGHQIDIVWEREANG